MGQAVSCCASCCPCPSRRKALAAAVDGAEAEDDKSNLLPPPSSPSRKKTRKPLGKKTSSKYRRPPSHLRELSGDINQVVRLVLVGGCDTGKTCLLRRFLGGYFDHTGQQDYARTLGVDFGCKTVELADRRVRLQMWDTGGSDTYRSVVSHYLRGADGVILCFDVTRKATLRALRSTWAPFLDKHTSRTCRVLLAGNKGDCRGDSGADGTEVAQTDAKRFADAIEAQVFETSAKLGTNVDAAVSALMREVLHHRQFAAQQEKADAGKEDGSVKRKGRRRLAVALRDVVMGNASEGGSESSYMLRGGNDGTAPNQAHGGSDGAGTEGTTSSAWSISTSHREDGDSSDQENHEEGQKKNRGDDHLRGSWGPPFPGTDFKFLGGGGGGGGGRDYERSEVDLGADLPHEISVLRGSSTDGGLSMTSSSIDGGRSSMADSSSIGGAPSATSRIDELEGSQRRGQARRPVSGDSNSADRRGGRYHLVNQLVIASPSRGANPNGIGIEWDGGGGGGGGDGDGGGGGGDDDDNSAGRGYGHTRHGERPERRQSRGGRGGSSSRTNSFPHVTPPSPTPGTGTVSAMSVRPSRSVAASQSDVDTTVAVAVDGRQRLQGGGRAKASSRDTPKPGYGGRRGTSTANDDREESPSHVPAAIRVGIPSEATVAERKSPVEVGGLRSSHASASASSSFSTVIAGEDKIR